MSPRAAPSVFRPQAVIFLGLIFVVVACVSVYLGVQRPLVVLDTPLESIRANSGRLSLMIIGGIATFFSITFFARGIKALKRLRSGKY